MEKYFESPIKPRQNQVIRVQHLEDLPEGAVLMSQDEVLRHHMNIITTWKKPSEIWPLRYGLGVMGGSAAISGFLINAHYRQAYKLMNYGRVASYLPSVCLPAMLAFLFHGTLVVSPILVGDFGCPLCIQTRSGSIAAGLGAVYPLIIGQISSIILARKYYTMSVPKITEATRLFSLFQKTSPLVGGLFLIAAQFCLGMFMADRELRVFQDKIAKTPRDLHNEDIH